MENEIDESRIIHHSDQCVVVNKLPGEATEGAGRGMIDLPKLLTAQLGGPFSPVNRLDVPVSGCALFARSPAALAFLSAAFAKGGVRKHYWAIVEMPPPGLELPETGELVHWLETDLRHNKSVAFAEEAPGRKKALLRHATIGRGTNYLFMTIELVTGRHHQIRAQLAALGLHIKGDLKYGAKRSEKTGGIRLHAHTLRFPAPRGTPGPDILTEALPPLHDRLWEDFHLCLAGASAP